MTLYDLIQNYPNISAQKKRQALQKVIDFIDYEDDDDDDGFLYSILELACDLEADDYFGTEGLKL